MNLQIAFGLLMSLVFFLGSGPAGAKSERKTIRWMIAHNPGNQPITDLVQTFAKKLESKTGGQLSIELVPSPVDQENLHFMAWKKIQAGDLEMSQLSITFMTQFNRQIAALELPFLFRNYLHAATFMESPLAREMLNSIAPGTGGVMRAFAFSYSGGNRVLYGSRKVAKLTDLKGAKIWESPSPVRKGFLQKLGVRFVGQDPGASRERRQLAFEKGEANLEENELNLLAVGRANSPVLRKFGKYVNESNHSLFMTMIVVRESFFKSLSSKQQKALEQVMAEFAAEERKLSIETEVKNRKALADEGVAFTRFPAKDLDQMRAVALKYRDEFPLLKATADMVAKMPDAENHFKRN